MLTPYSIARKQGALTAVAGRVAGQHCEEIASMELQLQ